MSYTPATDFLALLRTTGNGVRTESMPGLDWFAAALARAGVINIYVGATAPTQNQSSTVWFQPAAASWSAEGTLYLWNAAAAEYQVATPALWSALLVPNAGYQFQSAGAANNTVLPLTSLLAIQRVAPAATALVLPSLAVRRGKALQIVDFSTEVANHAITITTPDGATIMQKASWELLSTDAQLGGLTLYPSVDLNAWIIAP